jgi:hypothetical protein
MKFQHLVILGITTFFTVSCNQEVTTTPPTTLTPSATTVATPVAVSGKFQAGEHPIQGTLSVVNEQGKRYLTFDENFKTDNGPDVFVILYRSDKPPVYGIKKKDYLSVAKLQKFSGSQRYLLPDNVQLTDFRSVAIWCRKFNATFGYAPLL